jgi:hypothetical protein
VLANGTIVISSLEYFRRLEEAEWADIGDPLEGASELTLKGDFVIHENSSELAPINSANIGLGMFKQFAAGSGGGRIDMSGVRFVHQVPNLFIYSVSAGDIGDLTARMCVNAKRPYDACLGIADLAMLQRTAFGHGRVHNLDCAVSDIFLPGLIKAVEYEPRSRDIRQGQVIEPSPFKKAERFGGQSEVRVLFVPKDGAGITEQRLIIELPNPASTRSSGITERTTRKARRNPVPKHWSSAEPAGMERIEL